MNWITPWTSVLIGFALVAIWWIRKRSQSLSNRLSHVKGPRGLPLLGNALDLKLTKYHLQMTSWAKQFGPVCKVDILGTPSLLISTYDAIYETLVTHGDDTAGRPQYFRYQYLFSQINTSVTFDSKWKLFRRLIHKQLKHYGKGVNQVEQTLMDISQEMFNKFGAAADQQKAMDPSNELRSAIAKTISVLVCGSGARHDDSIPQALNQYEPAATTVAGGATLGIQLLESFPFTIHLPLPGSRLIKETVVKRDILLSAMKLAYLRTKCEDSLMGSSLKALVDTRSGVTAGGADADHLTEFNILVQCVHVLHGGITTTTLNIYTGINLLAHHPDIQNIMAEEISSQVGESCSITLQDRSSLPYTRAVLLEILRYNTVVPLGIPRFTTADTTIAAVPVPKGTTLFINLWWLHHDPEFWGDPDKFRPERFLDDGGLLLPADHPNRKHLMPFSAGIRACVGDQLAQIRMFLLLSNLVKRFVLLLAPGNTPDHMRVKNFVAKDALRPMPYKVIFRHRPRAKQP